MAWSAAARADKREVRDKSMTKAIVRRSNYSRPANYLSLIYKLPATANSGKISLVIRQQQLFVNHFTISMLKITNGKALNRAFSISHFLLEL